MATVYCRCCLIKDVRMVEVDRALLNDECMRLTGFVISNPLLSICYECAAKFKNYVKFRNKCLRANTLLLEILNKNNNMLTIGDLQSIDRRYYNLESQYKMQCIEKTDVVNDEDTKKQFEPDYYITIKTEEENNAKLNNFDISQIKKLSHSDSESQMDRDYSDADDKDYDYELEEKKSKTQGKLKKIKTSANKVKKQISKLKELSHTASESEIDKDYSDEDDKDDYYGFKDILKERKSNSQTTLKKLKSPNKLKKLRNVGFGYLSEDDFTPIENYFSSKNKKSRSQRIATKNGLKLNSITFDTQITDADLGVKPKKVNNGDPNFNLNDCDDEDYSTIDDFKVIENYLVGNKNKTDKDLDIQIIPNSDLIQFNEEPKKIRELIEKNIGMMVASTIPQDDGLSNVFNIVALTPEMSRQEVLLRKESSNYKNSKYKCNMCFRGFLVDTTYKNHMKKHTDEFGKWECEFCHMRSKSRRQLRKHCQHHKNKYICMICPQIFFDRSAAMCHINLHKGIKYPCDECERTFNLPHCLSNHKRMVHAHTCVCELCGSTFPNVRGLSSHKSLIHKQEENLKLGGMCVECDVVFSTETAWKRHLVLSARHNVSNGCEICGEAFNTSHALNAHKQIHIGKEIRSCRNQKRHFICKVCGEKLPYKVDYEKHMSTVHPDSNTADQIQQKNYVCEQCGKMFTNKSMFSYHMNRHTGNKPFKCQTCGKSYSNPTILYTHKKTHLPIKAKCHLCNKIYKTKDTLTKHIKTHFNTRAHKCEYCGKPFAFPYQVRTHIKYVHNKEPWPKRDRAQRKYANYP